MDFTGPRKLLPAGYVFCRPSSCIVNVAWDWTYNGEAYSKWGQTFQGYRLGRPYNVDEGGVSYDDGRTVMTSKTKIRGNGRSISLVFNSEPGHAMDILGWSIAGSTENVE